MKDLRYFGGQMATRVVAPQPHFLSRLCVCVVYRSAVELSIYCYFTFASSCYCWKAYNIPDRYRNLKENIFFYFISTSYIIL